MSQPVTFRMRPRGFWLVVALLVVATPGAAESESDSSEAAAGDKSSAQSAEVDTTGLKNGCFFVRDVRNFEALNRQYLIVFAPNKRRSYLVFIAPPSIELRNAITIGFQGRDRICGRTGERLLTDRSSGFGRSASILNVWSLDEATVDRLLESKRRRENPEVAPAEKSPGAEVETDIKPADNEPSDSKADEADSERSDDAG
jgi:hypothetical protein